MSIAPFPDLMIEPVVRRALEEDLGNSGDLSANLLIPEAAEGHLRFRVREDGVLSGWQAARLAYALVDSRCALEISAGDGSKVSKGDVVAEVRGPSRALLTAERTALNFVGRMSGIASLTRQYADAVKGTDVRIAATRKTTPGLRALEKQAVQHGGGFSHRESLAAAIMIKDNHIALAGGIEATMKTLRARTDHMTKISVEVDSLAQLETLLPFEPDVVLLDNMGPDTLREAVALRAASAHRAPLFEASGGVNLKTVRGIAESGIDVISVGALTHSAPNFDIGLDSA
jgi:nicotinate-nucleotide pyrophosphorylase (carboxylating)